MILYLDTSALVKLYAQEQHSNVVRKAVSDAELILCHVIAYAEARAALARKHRLGELSRSALVRVKREFDLSWASFDRVALSEPLIRRAGDLAETFALRGFDSVHLSAAESLMTRAPTTALFCFAVFDDSLADAARTLGMELVSAP